MTPEHLSESESLTFDPGGWITCRVLCADADADDWLSKSIEPRHGNLRFARDHHSAYLIGEIRNVNRCLTSSDVHNRLSSSVADLPVRDDPEGKGVQIEVASMLGETGLDWSQIEDTNDRWKAATMDHLEHRIELQASLVHGGVQVRSRLATWQGELPQTSREALVEYLAVANGRVRFVRFQLQDHGVHADSFAAADRLEIELPDSVSAVATACQLVGREVLFALTDESVAKVYLETTGRN